MANVYHMTRKNGRKGRTTRKYRKMVGGDDIDDNYDMNLGLIFGGIVVISLALAIGRV